MADVEVRVTGSVDSSVQTSTSAASASVSNLGTITGATAAEMTNFQAKVAAALQAQYGLSEASSAAAAGVKAETAAVAVSTAVTEANTVAVVNNRAAYEGLVLVHEALSGRYSRVASSGLILTQALAGQAKTAQALSAVMSPLGIAVAATAVTIGALAVFAVKSSLATEKWANDLEHTSEAIGLTTTQLQQMDLIANASDIPIDKMRSSLKGLSEEVGTIQDSLTRGKSGKQVKVWEAILGDQNDAAKAKSDLRDLGTNIDALTDKVVDFASKLGPTQRAGLAQALHIDPVVLDSLVDAKTNLANLNTEAEKYGIIIPADVIAKSAEAAQKMSEWKAIISGELRVAFIDLAPAITGGTIVLANMVKNFTDFIKGVEAASNDVNSFTSDIERAIGPLGTVGTVLKTAAGDLGIFAKAAVEAALPMLHLVDVYQQLQELGRHTKPGADGGISVPTPKPDKALNFGLSDGTPKKKKATGVGTEWQDELRAQELAAELSGQTSADALLQIEIKFWQGKVAATKVGSEQHKQAIANLEEAEVNLAKNANAEKLQIADDNAATTLEIEKISIAQRKAAAEVDFRDSIITAQNKHDILVGLLREEAKDELDALEARKPLYAQDVVELNKIANQERAIEAHLNADILESDVQLTADKKSEDQKRADSAKKAADEAAKAWKTANNELLGAEKTLVNSILEGKKNLGQIIGQIAFQTAEKEITADVQYFTERALLEAEGLQLSTSKEEGGMLVHLLAERQKSAATATGVATRSSVENTGFFATIIRDIAGLVGIHVAGETAKTAASAAGASARTAATVAGIPAEAALAGAGGVASMAAAPFPIDLGAPAFGASMAAAALGVGVFAEGTNVVPNDMIAQIHEGERIVPKADNRALIDAANGGGGGGGHTFNFGDFNVHGAPTGMSPSDFKQALSDHSTHVASAVADGLRGGFRPRYKQPYGVL